MWLCDQVTFSTWHPDQSSSRGGHPRWTKIEAGNTLLCNSIEWVDWTDDPVQVVICEDCGFSQCAVGNYVRLVRLGDSVVWTRPALEFEGDWEAAQFTALPVLRTNGSVIIPDSVWESWRVQHPKLPTVASMDQMTRRDVELAWLLEFPPFSRLENTSALLALLQSKAVAAMPGSVDEALGAIAQIGDWVAADPTREVLGSLRPLAEVDGDTVLLALRNLGPKATGLRQWLALMMTPAGPLPILGDFVATP